MQNVFIKRSSAFISLACSLECTEIMKFSFSFSFFQSSPTKPALFLKISTRGHVLFYQLIINLSFWKTTSAMQSKSRVQTTEDLAGAYYTWCKQIILPKRPINSYRSVKKGGGVRADFFGGRGDQMVFRGKCEAISSREQSVKGGL